MQKKVNVVSITSNKFKFDLKKVPCKKVVLIGDGSEPILDCNYHADETIIFANKKVSGSYFSRNVGLELLNNDEDFILLIDDDVVVDVFPDVDKLERDVLYVPNIITQGEAKTYLEKWYKINAFDQKTFVEKEKFAPTITWLFNKKDVRFDSLQFTGNDVTTSKLFKKIELLDDFRIITKLRTDNKIKMKFMRQATGHIQKLSFLKWIAYMIKNFLLGNGLHNLKQAKAEGFTKFEYFLSCYVAGFYKMKSIFLAGLSKYFKINKYSQENINKQEVNSEK